jgi:hypothetical protein
VFAGGVHLGGLSVLLGKIVPAGFSLSNLFLGTFRAGPDNLVEIRLPAARRVNWRAR